MFNKRNSMLRRAVMPVGCVVAANLLLASGAQADSTWIGAIGNFGDAANWAGSPVPPGGDLSIGGPSNGSFTSNGSWPNLFIGNNGVVNVNGVTTGIQRVRVGYAAPGLPNPGTGVLEINSGGIMTQPDSFIGDGADGTLTRSG